MVPSYAAIVKSSKIDVLWQFADACKRADGSVMMHNIKYPKLGRSKSRQQMSQTQYFTAESTTYLKTQHAKKHEGKGPKI